MHDEKTEKIARQIEKVIESYQGGGLWIDGGVLRDILHEHFGGKAKRKKRKRRKRPNE
jgi:hypothetical protein